MKKENSAPAQKKKTVTLEFYKKVYCSKEVEVTEQQYKALLKIEGDGTKESCIAESESDKDCALIMKLMQLDEDDLKDINQFEDIDEALYGIQVKS